MLTMFPRAVSTWFWPGIANGQLDTISTCVDITISCLWWIMLLWLLTAQLLFCVWQVSNCSDCSVLVGRQHIELTACHTACHFTQLYFNYCHWIVEFVVRAVAHIHMYLYKHIYINAYVIQVYRCAKWTEDSNYICSCLGIIIIFYLQSC